MVIQQGSKIKINQIFLYSIFYSKKTKKYRSNNIIDELNFFRKLLLTIKIFRIENVMDFTFLFIAVVRYG
ncbi:hypothetical protein, partial [Acinetobacter baumannii]|uniref:hypothetical protein n=1 Tax=Acinetobacter baumannii TaxID=470 RepID=UPI00222181C9